MENFDDPFDDDEEIDPELWLQYLLAMNNDKQEKETLISRILKKTGLPYEKAELILDCTLSFMANKVRSN
jgi:hypothetical protein